MQGSPEQDAIWRRSQQLARRMVNTNEMQLMLHDANAIAEAHGQRGHDCNHLLTPGVGAGVQADCDVAVLAHYLGWLAQLMGAQPE